MDGLASRHQHTSQVQCALVPPEAMEPLSQCFEPLWLGWCPGSAHSEHSAFVALPHSSHVPLSLG